MVWLLTILNIFEYTMSIMLLLPFYSFFAEIVSFPSEVTSKSFCLHETASCIGYFLSRGEAGPFKVGYFLAPHKFLGVTWRNSKPPNIAYESFQVVKNNADLLQLAKQKQPEDMKMPTIPKTFHAPAPIHWPTGTT